MSDDDLRRLAHAAQADPHDLSAGLALARALERGGDRRGLHLELCRLARAGSREAEEALDRFVPWPGRSGRGGTAFARCRPLPFRYRQRRGVVDASELVAATNQVVILRAEDGLVGIDAAELTTLWRVPVGERGFAVLSGEDLVTVEGTDLLLRDSRTGGQIARAALPGTVLALSASGDRAVALLRQHDGRLRFTAAFDLAEARFGAVLWRRASNLWLAPAGDAPEREFQEKVLAVGPRVHFHGYAQRLETWTVEDGHTLWEAPVLMLHAADRVGVLARLRDDASLVELGSATGSVCWRTEPPVREIRPDLPRPISPAGPGQLWAMNNQVVVYPNATALCVLARATGAVRPLAPIESARQVPWEHSVVSVDAVLGDGVLFAARVEEDLKVRHERSAPKSPAFLRLMAFDLTSGHTRLDEPFEVEHAAELGVALVPLDEALLVLVPTPAGDLQLLRFEPDTPPIHTFR
jgi:hypothetical protein